MSRQFPEDNLVLTMIQELGQARIRRGIADDQLYRYHGGVWDSKGEDEVQRRMDLTFSEYPASKLRNVRYLLHGIEPDFPEFPADHAKYMVNVRNGVVNLTTHPNPSLEKHEPDHFFRYMIPHEYDPLASCPHIDAALATMFPDPEMVSLIHEVLGYCLLPGVNMKKAILFHSRAPHTGKSSLLNLIGALVGHENEATVSLQDLDDHRFARASLQGKLINRSGDLGAYAPKTSANFKSLVGGDPVLAEHKGQRQFALHNTAKLLFAGNSFAGTFEAGAAYTDRWLVIPFVVAHSPDPDFISKVTTEAELQGLLKHAVHGAARLIARHHFPKPVHVELAERQLQMETDSVARYVGESLTNDVDGVLSAAATYEDYKMWAKDGGMRPVGRPKFYERVGDMPGGEVLEGKGRVKMIRGFSLAFPTESQEAQALRLAERFRKNREDGSP